MASVFLTVVTLLLAFSSDSVTRLSEPRKIDFGFWNVENLFDTEDDRRNPGDDEYLPRNGWTEERYRLKITRLAEIVAGLDCELLAVSEVENRRVLEDLIAHRRLRSLGYRIAHRDSPDKRGIDLALLYRNPLRLAAGDKSVRLHPIAIDPPTRGILEVRLRADAHDLTVFVNHWPSRRGGALKTAALRATAAERLRAIVLEREDEHPGHDILILGDLNDDPFDDSVRRILKAVRSRNATLNNRRERYLYNPSWSIFGQTDVGTLYYNREWVWNVFDQCILNRALLEPPGFQYEEGSIRVYATDTMRDEYRRPRFFRKNREGKWTEGYSDHFPIQGRLRYGS